MRFFFLYMIFCLLLSCSTSERVPVNNPPPPPPPGGPLKTWLALGDSYTIGQGVDAADRFPTQTVNLLLQAGINISTPDYIAATGWTSGVLTNQVQSQNPDRKSVV